MSPSVKCFFRPRLYAFNASNDGVVASMSGVSNFSTVASDSPTRVLNLLAILLRAFSTSSFLATCVCSASSTCPLRQSTARNPKRTDCQGARSSHLVRPRFRSFRRSPRRPPE
jgi:hypothetical protein